MESPPKKSFWKFVPQACLDWWVQELFSFGMSTLSLAALLGLLTHYSHRPLPLWTSAVTLNGVIAVISTVWRTSMMFGVADCLSQWKWRWFSTRRPGRTMADLELFDQASRGPYGSLELIWKRKTSPALLGAVIMILALAFDPMAQQLVAYPLQTTRVPSTEAKARRAVQYTMIGNQKSVTDNLKNGELDHNMRAMIDFGMSFSKHVVFDPWVTCSGKSNCTWSPFSTLGICSSCIDMTQKGFLSTNCSSSSEIPLKCSLNLANITTFFVEADRFSEQNPGSRPHFLSTTSLDKTKVSRYLNLNASIAEFASLKLYYSNDSTSVVRTNASICSLQYCVQTWQIDYVSNATAIHVHHTWVNNETSSFDKDGGVTLQPTPEDLHIDPKNYEKTTFHVPPKVSMLIVSYLTNKLNGSIWSYETDGHGALQTSHGPSDSFMNFLYTQTSTIFDNIAWAMTVYMRSIQENTPYQATGYTIVSGSVVEVGWAWLTLPLLLYLMSALLLVLTITMDGAKNLSNERVPIWKSSSLALLLHAQVILTDEDRRALQKRSEMKVYAGLRDLELRVNDEKWMLA